MVVASDVFPLIHALLISAGLKKTASKLTKEAKIQSKAFKSEHDLLDVYQFYLTHNTKKAKEEKKKKEKVKKVPFSEKEKEKKVKKTTTKAVIDTKEEESGSDSDEEPEEEKKKSIKKTSVVKKEESSSFDDSSDFISDEETKKFTRKTVPVNKKKVKNAAKDLVDEVNLKPNKRKTTTLAVDKNTKKAKREADSSSDDSSDSSSSDDSSSDSSDSDSDSDTSDDEEAQKKEAVRREEASKAALEWRPKKIEKVVTKTKSAGTPFQRVDGEFWSQKILDDTLRDNSYEGTFGVHGVGVKANNKLLKTRGKDFTKGKNKFKRSTYMCGAISMASNSFKFEE